MTLYKIILYMKLIFLYLILVFDKIIIYYFINEYIFLSVYN